MAPPDPNPFAPFGLSPEEEACLRIIDDYQHGRLSLEAAAPQLLDAMQASPRSLNIAAGPRVRRLLAEVHRLAGGQPVAMEPRRDRHADGGKELLEHLEDSVWRALAKHPRANEPLSIGCHFAAATEAAAKRLESWLQTHGDHTVVFTSHFAADTDDWIIRADTPPTRWTRAGLAQWATWVRGAPRGG